MPEPLVQLRRELFQPTLEGEARLLILIQAFSDRPTGLDGRTKLAKLDFLLRYPAFFVRAMAEEAPEETHELAKDADETVETRMIRYRYGPWDPAYFTLIGRLVARRLVRPVRTKYGIGLIATSEGQRVAERLAATEPWRSTSQRAALLKVYFDKSGDTLKKFVYKHFPEVTKARMGETL